MANLLCGGFSDLNPNKGVACPDGYTTGLIFSESKNTAVALASMSLKSTFTALQKADRGGRVWYIPVDKATPGTTEPVMWTADSGSQTLVNVTRSQSSFEIVAGQCAIRSIHGFFKNQKTGYVWVCKSSGAILGQEITPATSEQIKVKIHTVVTEGTPTDPTRIMLYMNYEEQFEDRMVLTMPTDFEHADLLDTNVTDLYFEEVSNTLTALTVNVTSPCGDLITSLSRSGAGNFILYNTTDSAAITITGITGSGNQYILAFAAQTEADDYKLYYKAPSTTNELYELVEDRALTGTLTA